jgi:DNA polymerase (family 10)
MDRHEVASALREIAALMEAEGANTFKVRAYERGARAVDALREDVTVLAREGRLTQIPGVGSGLAATIDELVRTGRSAQLETLRGRMPAGVLELLPVLSLQKVKAVTETLGIRTLEELKAAAEAGKLRKVKGFGEATEKKVLQAIGNLSTAAPLTLLYEATREAESLLAFLLTSDAVARAEIGGALRRRVETVDRIEVVLASADPAAALEHVARYSLVTHVLEREEARIVVRLGAGIPAHVEVVPAARFAPALHRSTGSPKHREDLAAWAAARKATLDEEGVKRGGRRVKTPSEETLYEALGLRFIPPELREGWGEVEAAATGDDFSDLVAAADVRGLVHCHTTYSDGKHSVEEMAKGAEALGMEYITFTDHSPTASYARGLTLDRLQKQWDDIARAQEKVKVRLLRGTESDILENGALDYPDRVLEQLDVIIASVHNRYRMDREAMTRRIVAAMKKPLFKVWGHALGRYVLTRPPFDADVPKILDVIAESRAAVEINGDPHRLDMEPKWIREARARGIRFTISTDAHSVGALRNVRWGADMARRGGVRRAEVLNTRPVEEFRAAVKP